MSVANFGPTFRSQTVTNTLVAPIEIPATPVDDFLTNLALIKTAGNVEIPLLLGEGVWSVRGVAFLDPIDVAQTIQFGQAVIINTLTGARVASSTAILGADILGATNVLIECSADCTLVIAPGATANLALRYLANGIGAGNLFTGVGDPNLTATMTAIKLN